MMRVVRLKFAALLAAALASRAEAQAQTTPVTFSLDFRALGRHAAWYVALEKGYYKNAGLDVTIIPSQGTAQAIQSVESKAAQFAFSDVAGPGRGARQQRGHRQDGRGDLPEGAIRDLLAALRRQRHQARAARKSRDRQRRRLLHPEGDRGLHEVEGAQGRHREIHQHRSGGADRHAGGEENSGDRDLRHVDARRGEGGRRRRRRRFSCSPTPGCRSTPTASWSARII